LPPIQGHIVAPEIKEPSGLTYCESTGTLYCICDKGSCHYIYEVSPEGELLGKHGFNKSYTDIESVACDDVNKLIYIGEEGAHRIHSFYLPNRDNHDEDLEEVGQFRIEPASDDTRSGLEGMTVDTTRNVLYITNEKHPKVLYTVQPDGTILDMSYPDFDSGDLSGVCYDNALDLIWYLSDQKERLYVADLTGTIVYDYWDLPMQNPEGIAIDNTKEPPLLYIATDPSAPTGPSYVPALFMFAKPEIGTGLVYHDEANPPEYALNSPPCDGCDAVWLLANQLSAQYNQQVRHQQKMETLAITLPILGGLFIAVILFALIAYCYVKKLEASEGFYPNNENYGQKSWYEKIKAFFGRKVAYEQAGDGLLTDYYD